MKMRKWLVLVALLVGAASAQAKVFYWSGDWLNLGTSDGNWATTNNWYDTTIGTALELPGVAEHVIIDEVVASANVGTMPTIGTAVPTVNILTLGWAYAGTATLTMTNGASLIVAGSGAFTRLGQAAGSTSYLNMTGGSLESSTIHVGFYGDGTINMSGDAIIHTPDLGFGEQFALGGTGVVTMVDNAKLRYDTDVTATGSWAEFFVDSGYIRPLNIGDKISYSYDAGNNWTEFTVGPNPVPEIGDIMLDLLPGTNALSLTWATGAGFVYTVESKTDLMNAIWATNTTVIGIGGDMTITTAVDQVKSFYRVLGDY